MMTKLENGSAEHWQEDSEFEQDRIVEAILFGVSEPVTVNQIKERLSSEFDVRSAIKRLVNRYSDRGVRICRVGDAWAFRTAPDLSFILQREKKVTRRMSRAAMETLAIIAYHQPVTRAEIEEIRGVSVSRGTLDILILAEWVGLGPSRKTPGRPSTYVVTRHFLDYFGLESVHDLPGLSELRDSGLLDMRAPEEGLRLEEFNGVGGQPSGLGERAAVS